MTIPKSSPEIVIHYRQTDNTMEKENGQTDKRTKNDLQNTTQNTTHKVT